MNTRDLSDKEIIEIVQPLAEHTEQSWNKKDYRGFIRYLMNVKADRVFPEEEFQRQINESFDEYGEHTISDLIAIHRNPDHVIVMWKVRLEKREEPGMLMYVFREHEGVVLIDGCSYHA